MPQLSPLGANGVVMAPLDPASDGAATMAPEAKDVADADAAAGMLNATPMAAGRIAHSAVGERGRTSQPTDRLTPSRPPGRSQGCR
jgi:hypothetical protein